jgi:predicted kinase
MESLLIITGSMGAGKSAVLAEASDLLAAQRIEHAAIDLDALGLAYLPGGSSMDELMYRNLRSICENCALRGISHILLARAIETPAELDLCRQAATAKNTVVCRLIASVKTMQERVRTRELGIGQAEFVARVAKLNAILDGAHLEDFSVLNEGRSVTEVAREVLQKAAWILT